MAGKVHGTSGAAVGQGASLTNGPDTSHHEDLAKKVDQAKVTSKVKRDGTVTVRTYSDGAVQRLAHDNEQAAKDYAASVTEQGA